MAKSIEDLKGDTATPSEVAEVLKTPLNAVYRAINARQIPAISIGRNKLVPTAWLRQVLGADAKAA